MEKQNNRNNTQLFFPLLRILFGLIFILSAIVLKSLRVLLQENTLSVVIYSVDIKKNILLAGGCDEKNN